MFCTTFLRMQKSYDLEQPVMDISFKALTLLKALMLFKAVQFTIVVFSPPILFRLFNPLKEVSMKKLFFSPALQIQVPKDIPPDKHLSCCPDSPGLPDSQSCHPPCCNPKEQRSTSPVNTTIFSLRVMYLAPQSPDR